jgi:nucleoside-diphosphate-sugar epimerase
MADHRPAVFVDENIRDWKWKRGYVENIAHAIALATTDDRAAGRIYNVAEEQHYTEFEWAARLARAMNYGGKLLTAPTDRLPKSLQADIDSRQQMIADSSRIRRELGYAEVVPEDVALERTIKWELVNAPKDSKIEDEYAVEDALIKT